MAEQEDTGEGPYEVTQNVPGSPEETPLVLHDLVRISRDAAGFAPIERRSFREARDEGR